MLAADHQITEMHRLMPYSGATDGNAATSFVLPTWQPAFASPVETRKLEAEVCRRFVQVSCAKMHASRQSRSGARLYKNLLILRLLVKARNNVAVLPYECASLLRRKQHFNTNQLSYDEEDELPSRKHFQQNFSIITNNNKNVDLNNQNAQPNDISAKSHNAEALRDNATTATIATVADAVDEDENLSMEISYIQCQQNRLRKINKEDHSWDDTNSKSLCTAANSEEDARRDACADAEIVSMMAAAAQTDSIDMDCSNENEEKEEICGRRLYERVSSVSIEQDRVFTIDACESHTATTIYYERADKEPTEYRDTWFNSRLLRDQDTSYFSTTLSNAANAMTFRLVNEIPSLHSVMNNSVSPPLGTINNELLSNFPTLAATTSTAAPNTTFFDDREKMFVASTDGAVCECDENDQISLEESVLYCRKRKTSVNNLCNAVDEKRHCCEEHDNMIATTGSEFGGHFFDVLAPDNIDTDCCQKCGGQILRNTHTTLDYDEPESIIIDNELTTMRIVPDIDATPSLHCHNTMSMFADGLCYKNNGNNDNMHNFSAWLMDKTQFQQQSYQQLYRYCSNTMTYGNSNMTTVNNDSCDKNNCFIKTQQQQNKETGSGGGSPMPTAAWDQVVPIGRGRGHFVGPLVGLVAETPYILMF